MGASKDAKSRTGSDRPLSQPPAQQSGTDVGGIHANAEGGLEDAMQRSMEEADGSAMGRASTGDAGGGAHDPRLDLGGTNEPGAADTPMRHADCPRSDDRATPRSETARADRPSTTGAAASDDDGDGRSWRHEPVAPVDEKNPLKSIGRAVADTITGGAESEGEIDAESGAKKSKR